MTRRPNKRERRADIDPEPIDAALKRVTSALGWAGDLSLVKIRESWVEVVGPILASRAVASKLNEAGGLEISCDHGATANEVSMLQEIIIKRATEISGTSISALVVRVRSGRTSRGK